MADSRFVFTPNAAEFPTANYPQLTVANQRPALAFDAGTDEACQWTAVAPQGLGTTLTVKIFYIMASATTGLVDFEADVEAVTPDSDTVDLDAGDSFDTANAQAGDSVPGTAGYLGVLSITLTNKDSIAVGDYFRLRIRRDADDVTNDTATGDCLVLAVELQDA
jgi:hypothetical protein